MTKLITLLKLVLAFTAIQVLPVGAQVPKDRNITLVVPFTGGSGADGFARVLANHLQSRLGQTVIVENRAGASGNIGTMSVAQSQPDGTVLLLTANTIVMNVGLFKSLGYDPIKSFAPIIEIGTGHVALVSNIAFPPKNVAELVAYAKERPGQVNYGSPGRGTPHHLAMELLKTSAKIDLVHVPYPGLARSISDLVGGHINTMFVGLTSILPHVKEKQVHLLGVGSRHRVKVAPDAPTIAEQGFEGFEVGIWYGLFAPAGTPSATVQQLNKLVNEIIKLPDVEQFMSRQGIEAGGGDPERLERLLVRDLKRWLDVIRQAGIKAE